MARIIMFVGILATAIQAQAYFQCRAICHYYLPNSSHTHPSLPDQSHETLIETTGDTEESAFEQLRTRCNALGMEPSIVHVAGEPPICWESSCTP